ncbi:predicted protein [Sclerotinia sclerotiorum 1980 UF-70]|uniref:Uncharacterized protein n=1 Tax=Sclerotinia sclerotiorum (strain ATCC 18683 / 1980 / Ss-1) TaxID=665079 RepID=A7EL11_SCLS1|nr:predicted protein [Sclerotinia sclerotiorum 1980 UF-70]EDO03527.1 predicted protein [Sclerotinia sclerotiorum 1980 UF-70]
MALGVLKRIDVRMAVAEERQGGYSAKEIVRLNLIVCDDSVLDPQAGLLVVGV